MAIELQATRVELVVEPEQDVCQIARLPDGEDPADSVVFGGDPFLEEIVRSAV